MTHDLTLDALRALSSSRLFLLCVYALAFFDATTIYDQPLSHATLDALRDAVNARFSDDLDYDLASLLIALLDANAYDDRSHLVASYARDLA